MSEMYMCITIPQEYVRGSDDPVTLVMPVSYARRLGQLLAEGEEAFGRDVLLRELELSFKQPADETEQEGGTL